MIESQGMGMAGRLPFVPETQSIEDPGGGASDRCPAPNAQVPSAQCRAEALKRSPAGGGGCFQSAGQLMQARSYSGDEPESGPARSSPQLNDFGVSPAERVRSGSLGFS